MEIYPISLNELDRITEIDVSEEGNIVYYLRDGLLEAFPEKWGRPKWTPDSWREDAWTRFMHEDEIKIWGCFVDERLAGIVVYRPGLTETMAQLLALFVSKDQRRKGIAARLCALVEQQARLDGYETLYVSATPSASAVGFYLSQGFQPTQDVHPELFELEPEDIHMVKKL